MTVHQRSLLFMQLYNIVAEVSLNFIDADKENKGIQMEDQD